MEHTDNARGPAADAPGRTMHPPTRSRVRRSHTALPAVSALALLLVSVPACAGQDGAGPVPSVILDGREPPVAAAPGAVAVPAVHEAMLRLAEARSTAMDRPVEEPARAIAAVEGSFTAPGARERIVLSLVNLWPRCCPLVELALFRGEAPAGHWLLEGVNQSLALVPGGGGEGRDAVFMVGSFGMGGDESGSATLVRIGDGGPEELGTFGLFESSCASGRPGATARAGVVVQEGGELFLEEYHSDCGEGWTSAGERVPLELQAPYQAMEWMELPLPPG